MIEIEVCCPKCGNEIKTLVKESQEIAAIKQLLGEVEELFQYLEDNKPMPFRCQFCYEMSCDYDKHEAHCPFTKTQALLPRIREAIQ